MHMNVFFYLVKFSCQNTIFLFKKNANENYETRMEKKMQKSKENRKIPRSGKGTNYFSSIFPHLICFLHFSTARLRLGQDLGGVSS